MTTSKVVKKKKVSKRNKIAWRKHVNVDDVEDFLEEQRLDERLGPPVETLSNDALFKLDTKPSEELLSKRERCKLKLLNPTCFAALRPHTQVPDPIVKRNRVRTKEERKNLLVKLKEEERKRNGILKAKEREAIQNKKLYELKKLNKPKVGEFNTDLWIDESKVDDPNDWIQKSTKKHALLGSGNFTKNPVHKPKREEHCIPKVENPHPGTSYNPSYKDHQDLLKLVADKELKVIKEEKHLERVTKDMFSRVTEKKRATNWMEEMSEGILLNPSNANDDASDTEYQAINPPVENKKKTLQQRRKQKEQRALLLAKQTVKRNKKKITDIHGLKMLKEKIQQNDVKLEKLRGIKLKAQEYKKKEARRLGPLKFDEPDLDFNMISDLTGNLRNVKKEGNLLVDRFKSLQKRSILEPTTKHVRKRSKIKRFTKNEHKDDWKKTVARA